MFITDGWTFTLTALPTQLLPKGGNDGRLKQEMTYRVAYRMEAEAIQINPISKKPKKKKKEKEKRKRKKK